MSEPSHDINTLLKKLTSGNISKEESKVLEQIALEDPFAKEAMEGYIQMSSDQSKNLEELETLIQEKGRRRKPTNYYLSWRIAASILLLIGAVSLIYFINPFRVNQPIQGTAIFQAEDQEEYAYAEDQESTESQMPITQSAPEPGISKTPDASTGRLESSRPRMRESAPADLPKSSEVEPNQVLTDSKAIAEEKSMPLLQGRIFDDTGNPLMGAKIYLNEKDSIIYTDLEGRFVLGLIDSNDRLTISYTGFETKQIELVRQKELESIILEENQTMMDEVVGRSLGKSESESLKRQSNSDAVALEEVPNAPIPLIGWPRYLAYIEQNRKVPRAAKKAKISGEVELMFSIDKNGRPQDIQIKKALGYGCDQEAIRLVREGPSWKIHDVPAPSMTEVSIRF